MKEMTEDEIEKAAQKLLDNYSGELSAPIDIFYTRVYGFNWTYIKTRYLEAQEKQKKIKKLAPQTQIKKKPIRGGTFEYYSVPVNGIFTEGSQRFYAITFRRGDMVKEVSVRAIPSDKQQYKNICVVYNRETIRIDEYWAYQNLFQVGSEYLFIVDYAAKLGKQKYTLVLKDKYGLTQECISTKYFDDNQQICCTVIGFRKNQGHEKCLILDKPRNFISAIPEETAKFQNKDRIIYFGWYEKLHLYHKHVCGKAAICSCCKHTFEFKQGYRFEGIDEYLCMECYQGIFPKKAKAYRKEWVRFINTNMGHKK